VDLPGYFRKVLASTPSDWPFEPERDSGRPGNSGFLIYHRTHPDEAARLAGDLARALKGEHVDLKGRLGVDERDVEIEVEHVILVNLYLKAFDSLTRQIYSAKWIERFDYWLQEKLNFSYDAPRLPYVKNAAARDDFARLFYQCWDKYLSKPDEYALRERYICLRDLTLVAYNPHPTATDEAMRQKLGVEPEKWKAFQQFIKDVRAGPGLWEERINPPKKR